MSFIEYVCWIKSKYTKLTTDTHFNIISIQIDNVDMWSINMKLLLTQMYYL